MKTAAGRYLLAGLTFLLLLAGCGELNRNGDPVIARVGKRNLTEGQITQALVQMHLDPADALLRTQYINSWVDRQLLLHEAEQQSIEQRRDYRAELNRLREELIVNKLLAESLDTTRVNEAAIVSYWRDHAEEFKRPSDEVRILVCRVEDRNAGWGIRNALDRAQEGETLQENYPGAHFDTTAWLNPARLPRRMASALSVLREGQSSVPFEMEGSWYVVKLFDRAAAGDTRPIDEVHDYIKSILQAELAERAQIDYISTLRRDARREGLVQINVPTQPQAADTTADNTTTQKTDTTDTRSEE